MIPQLCTVRCSITLPTFSQEHSGNILVNSNYIFMFINELFTQHVMYAWGCPNPIHKVVTLSFVVSPFVGIFNNVTPASGKGLLCFIALTHSPEVRSYFLFINLPANKTVHIWQMLYYFQNCYRIKPLKSQLTFHRSNLIPS